MRSKEGQTKVEEEEAPLLHEPSGRYLSGRQRDM